MNTVGVMGKGVALQFREAFPDNYQAYKKACEAMAVHVGKVFVTENLALTGPKYIVNFPTKKHWRQPSRIEYVTSGLRDLRRVLEQKKIRSVALPPLGCGNGGLDWAEVRAEIEKTLSDLQDVDVVVYQPTHIVRKCIERVCPSRFKFEAPGASNRLIISCFAGPCESNS